MDYEDQHDLELKRELNRRYGEEGPKQYEAAQRRRRFYLRLAALLVFFLFLATVAGTWLKTFHYPSLSFIRESLALSREPLVRELSQAVVQVETASRGTVQKAAAQWKGTGFNIEPYGLIVTNRHLVEEADHITVSFSREGRYSARVWYWLDGADLAVIVLDGASELPVVHPDFHYTLTDGEAVLVIGNPLSFTGIALRGRVCSADLPGPTGEAIAMIEAPIHPGHSGSPLFNEAGSVVGVVYASVTVADRDEPAGLAVLLPALRDLLDSLNLELST